MVSPELRSWLHTVPESVNDVVAKCTTSSPARPEMAPRSSLTSEVHGGSSISRMKLPSSPYTRSAPCAPFR